jgi:N-carbamoylputrescine amidase
VSRVKIGVCQGHPQLLAGSSEWKELCRSVDRERPDLMLLGEMPFGSWISAAPEYDDAVFQECVSRHEEGIARLSELGAKWVASTRPRVVSGTRVNEAYLWSREGGVRPVHTKQYFPDEEGYYEARWFDGGERHFRVEAAGELRAGFLICTELMFNDRAREYRRGGAQVILVPRATGKTLLPRWRVAMRMAAIVSGCYVLSSNRSGADSRGQVFGGRGWVVDPEGEVLAQSSATTPVVFHEIDTEWVARAQKDYPCYVRE